VHALHHGAELRRHQSRGLRAGDAQGVHCFLRVELQAARGTRGGGEYAQRRARMPARRDVRGAHAQPDARPDLVAGNRGRQELPSGHAWRALRDREQRGDYDRPHVKHARAVHVVQLETLHGGAVRERRVGGGELPARAPDDAFACRVHSGEHILQYAAPLQVRAVKRAAERVKHEELDAMPDFLGDCFEFQAGNEFRDAAGIGIVVGAFVTHLKAPKVIHHRGAEKKEKKC
jgi:hypothetical protein